MNHYQAAKILDRLWRMDWYDRTYADFTSKWYTSYEDALADRNPVASSYRSSGASGSVTMTYKGKTFVFRGSEANALYLKGTRVKVVTTITHPNDEDE